MSKPGANTRGPGPGLGICNQELVSVCGFRDDTLREAARLTLAKVMKDGGAWTTIRPSLVFVKQNKPESVIYSSMRI